MPEFLVDADGTQVAMEVGTCAHEQITLSCCCNILLRFEQKNTADAQVESDASDNDDFQEADNERLQELKERKKTLEEAIADLEVRSSTFSKLTVIVYHH